MSDIMRFLDACLELKRLPEKFVCWCYPWQEELVKKFFPGYDIKFYQWIDADNKTEEIE